MKHNSTSVELNSNCRAELCTLYPLQEHDNTALHAVATSNRTSVDSQGLLLSYYAMLEQITSYINLHIYTFTYCN